MNKYEIMFILKTLDEEKVKQEIENFKSIITNMKGEIIDTKEIGNKKLAYPIKKELNGYYYDMTVSANNEIITEFDRKAGINENIIRHIIIKLDEE